MNIERWVIRENGLEIPCVPVKPHAPGGAALIVQGAARKSSSGEQTANRK